MKQKNFLLIISIIFLMQLACIYYLINSISPIEIVKNEERIILTEADFIKSQLKEIKNSTLYVSDLSEKKEGSGIVLTSDGLVLTLNSNIPKNSDFDFRVLGKSKVYEVRKRDYENDLALVQIGETHLKPVSFAINTNSLGENVFVLGSDREGRYVFGQGAVRSVLEKKIKTDILGSLAFNGAPVFNKEGAILGIAKINEDNLVDVILIDVIKDFTNL